MYHAPREKICLAPLCGVRNDPRIECGELSDRLLKKKIEFGLRNHIFVIICKIGLRHFFLLHAPQKIRFPILPEIVHQPRMMRKDHECCHLCRETFILSHRPIPLEEELTARRRVVDLTPAAVISRMLTAPVKILCKLRRTLTEIMEYADEARRR